MRNFLRWLFNTSTALLPVKLRTKLRLLMHIGQYEFIKENFPFYRVSFTALPPGTGWELTMTAVPEVQP